ncbi:hypothetical protein X801_04902 [Opisthorchis viverrini]|uniref:Uncharacterized protein n=1 Tax=Opisthorchis viverrini TaxID=6198 RepID=A0A1S8WXU1_OPIVI|nr:hypothetical protein X801_04902 [Opisthorchis viverrini]
MSWTDRTQELHCTKRRGSRKYWSGPERCCL